MDNKTNGHKKDEITCVSLTKDTRNKLAKLGTKDQTFNEIIQNLIETPCVESVGENENE